MIRSIPAFSLVLLLSACPGSKGDSSSEEGDTDTDTDSDTDSDSDSDSDTDTDSDTDSDSDSDADADTGETWDSDGDTAPDSADDTAEPDDCDEETPVTLYVSPDDSNSMASPVLARGAALTGYGLRGQNIRVHEFMNYYTFAYDPADTGELALHAAMVETSEPGRYQLQYAISSESRDDRAPMNLTFSIDTSCSMSGTPLELVQDSLTAIAAELDEGDVVSLVEWSDSTATLLESLEIDEPSDPTLLGAINSLTAGGSTDLSRGLVTAYDLATANWGSDRINRVVLMSDGGANTGVTDIELIAAQAGGEDADGIYMVGVGIGEPGSYNDELMDDVTDAGKGAAVFVHSNNEIERVFTERFINTFDVAARNVSVQLDMPPGFEIERFSGEEYSTDRADIEPQHIAPNDAMVFYQTVHTCAPEAITDDSEITITVSWQDAVTFEAQSSSTTWTFAELLAADPALLEKGAAVYSYGTALKALARGDATSAAFEEARSALDAAELTNPADEELEEIREVIEALD